MWPRNLIRESQWTCQMQSSSLKVNYLFRPFSCENKTILELFRLSFFAFFFSPWQLARAGKTDIFFMKRVVASIWAFGHQTTLKKRENYRQPNSIVLHKHDWNKAAQWSVIGITKRNCLLNKMINEKVVNFGSKE